MRHSRSIGLVLLIVLGLGLFFQYNRVDGFLRLMKNTNSVTAVAPVKAMGTADLSIPQERYLVVYDPEFIHSVLLQRNIIRTLGRLKKEVKAVRARETLTGSLDYNGIFVAVENIERVAGLQRIRDYARSGGTVYFAFRPVPGPTLAGIQRELGLTAVTGVVDSWGVRLQSNLLIGGLGFELRDQTFTSSLKGSLAPEAKVHMTSLDGVPLVWEYPCGQGKYVVYNGTSLGLKQNRGLITGLLALGQEALVYPVMGVKMVYIDDFPAPVPEGTDADIFKDYRLSTAEFYRNIWWPDMLKAAERYGIRYTGVIVESYNDSTKPPFQPDGGPADRNNLVVYGRELLKSGGELGIHGYNHQSLVLPGYIENGGPDYVPWQSTADMAASLREVKRYVREAYPAYTTRVYVPPSNILSPEGRKTVLQELPDTKIIASVYFADQDTNASYIQEFEKAADGILEMPRVSFGYRRQNQEDWEILNAITFLGLFSHFVHPDNILYVERDSWKNLYKSYESLLADIGKKYSWLRGCTASEAGVIFEDYTDLDYRTKREGDRLLLSSGGYQNAAYFILRTARKIKEASGCQVESIDNGVYLLKVHDSNVIITFEGRAGK